MLCHCVLRTQRSMADRFSFLYQKRAATMLIILFMFCTILYSHPARNHCFDRVLLTLALLLLTFALLESIFNSEIPLAPRTVCASFADSAKFVAGMVLSFFILFRMCFGWCFFVLSLNFSLHVVFALESNVAVRFGPIDRSLFICRQRRALFFKSRIIPCALRADVSQLSVFILFVAYLLTH